MRVTLRTRLTVALVLNLGIVAAQAVAGFGAHSVGLLADAGHNLVDGAGLGLSLLAVYLSRRPPTRERSYGYHRSTVLAAQANAGAICVVTVLVAAESVHRFFSPQPVQGAPMVVVAAVALLVDAIAAMVLWDRSSRDTFTVRTAVLHMGGDALASLGVVVAGSVILITGRFAWLDPAVGLGIAALIAWGAVGLLRSTTDVLLESAPYGLDVGDLERAMAEVRGIDGVHDLHVWSLSAEIRALSAHLVLSGHPTLEEAQATGVEVRRAIADGFHIAHATLELECETCADNVSGCSMDELPPPALPVPDGRG
ncbi:MAG TPA: cation diffusion facilitator family transporter [Acidimicrobiales bacterium]|nr:cation diffusion facilitator family transporter [Acidimicrobiales bacterium]